VKNLPKRVELLLLGLDRVFGYRLRYPQVFNNVHLSTIGKFN
jgi:hypothetical protein